MELLAELAARFPKHGNPADELPRLRLLAEDLSEAMGAIELAAAIKVGKLSWRFLPTLAEIIEAGADHRAERRDRQREAEQRQAVAELRQPALPAPSADLEAERAAMMAELRAKLDAGHAKLMGTADAAPNEPYSWRLLREAGMHVSPQLVALQAELAARD